MTHKFDLDTALERKDDSTFLGATNRDWWVERGPHGGFLAALMLRAMKNTVSDPSRPVRSLTVHYIAPPTHGTLEVNTTIERVGKSRISTSARLLQEGATKALALAAFSSAWRSVEWAETTMPAVPAPSRLDPLPVGNGLSPPFFSNFDARPALGDWPFTGSTKALSGGWIRFSERRPLDDIAIAAFADAWMPSVFTRLDRPIAVPTVDLTVHFRAALPLEEATPDDYLLAVFRSETAADGFFVEDGDIWSAEGRLIAQARQLAVLMSGT
ncbi:MAG: acyl-CoA thioesterase [Actinomycetota bacterium]